MHPIRDITNISDLFGKWQPGKRISQLECDIGEFGEISSEEINNEVTCKTVTLKDRSGEIILILTIPVSIDLWTGCTYKFLMLKMSENSRKLIVSGKYNNIKILTEFVYIFSLMKYPMLVRPLTV